MTAARTGRRRVFLLRVAVMLVLWTGMLVAWAVVYTGRDDVGGDGTGSELISASAGALTISGSLLSPLRPGSSELLDLLVHNETDEILQVGGLSVRIVDVAAPNVTRWLGCSARDFDVEQSSFAFELDGESSSTLTGAGAGAGDLPLLTMVDSDLDQAGCVGATLALEYSAIGSSA